MFPLLGSITGLPVRGLTFEPSFELQLLLWEIRYSQFGVLRNNGDWCKRPGGICWSGRLNLESPHTAIVN